MAKSKSGLLRLTDDFAALIDMTIRKNAEGLIKNSDAKLILDLTETYIKAVSKSQHNPNSHLAIPKDVGDGLKNIKRKVDRRSNVSEHPIKNKTRIAYVPNRLDLIAIANSADYLDRFQSHLSLINKSSLNSVLDNIIIGDEKSKAVNNIIKQANIIKNTAKDMLSDKSKSTYSRAKLREIVKTADFILSKSPHLLGNLSANLVNDKLRFKNTVLEALEFDKPRVIQWMKDGLSSSEISDRLIAEYDKSLCSKKYARLVARNVITSVYNDVAVRSMRDGVEDGTYTNDMFENGVPSFRFSAVMDDRTSDICRHCNGMVILLSDYQRVLDFTPPLHSWCRSMLVANLK